MIFENRFSSRKLGSITSQIETGTKDKIPGDQKLTENSLAIIETHLVEADDDAIASMALNSPDEILSVERNCVVHSMAIPNDPLLQSNIGINLIGASKAWDISRDTKAVVAVIDTGVDLSHEDLSKNIWVNSAELNGLPGVDDDHNGYIDDINGWGFPEKSNDPTPGAYDGSDHGTHIAGIIGASANNKIGVAGIAWSTKMMALRVFSKTRNDAATSDIIESIYYAVNNGAQIINCSWGAEQTPSQAELDAYGFAESRGVLVVAAAGNDAKDASTYTPASISSVLAVGSFNSKFQMSSFSNFGSSVSVLAPGGDLMTSFGTGIDEEIFSTLPSNSYGYKRGTSSSAPFVSGLAALIKSILPQIDSQGLRELIKSGGDLVSIKKLGVTRTYSFINAPKTLNLAVQVSAKNPTCSNNCSLSGGADLSSTLSPSVTKFGGGGCSSFKNSDGAKSAASSGWDLFFLFSAFAPGLISRLVKALSKKKPQIFT